MILAFLGNIFFPLSGVMLTIAKFTPLYGYVALARYPLTEGHLRTATTTRCGCRSVTWAYGRRSSRWWRCRLGAPVTTAVDARGRQ